MESFKHWAAEIPVNRIIRWVSVCSFLTLVTLFVLRILLGLRVPEGYWAPLTLYGLAILLTRPRQ